MKYLIKFNESNNNNKLYKGLYNTDFYSWDGFTLSEIKQSKEHKSYLKIELSKNIKYDEKS